MIVTANSKGIAISPKKLARIVEIVKGHPALQAADELALVPKKGAMIVAKVIKAGIANAENNFKLESSKLVVSKIWVTDGTKRIKRVRFASRGRITTVQKYRSNLNVELSYGE